MGYQPEPLLSARGPEKKRFLALNSSKQMTAPAIRSQNPDNK
jgi:hypothetical protein